MVNKLPDTSKVKARLTTDFHRSVFAAVIQSFEQSDNPLRVNNFATGLRELTRLVLDYCAAEKSIKQCAWYVEEKNENGNVVITRPQRIKYAVQAGLPDDFVASLLVDVPETIRVFQDLIKRMNKLTHLTETTFGVDGAAADRFAHIALETFNMLLETIDDCRAQLHEAVEERAQDVLTDDMLEGTITALEEIATHYEIDDVNINQLKLHYMGPDEIVFKASGTVDCTLQYGSDSDVANDSGMRVDDHYPLTCEFVADISTPLDLKVRKLHVDNSSFYE
ncbi:MAG TPA: hypothetical protein VGF44_16755 [Terriglobales bacterium]